jgi:sugar phosphate isomerase/epimerase
MHYLPSRRQLLAAGAALGAASAAAPLLETTVNAQSPAPGSPAPAARTGRRARTASEPFGYCLNTSTIRGHNLSIVEEIDVAAEAGYEAIEPWIGKLDEHVAKGGSLKDLAKRISDHGMTVESAIGFAQWIVNDDAQRTKAMDLSKRDMDRVAQIGGKRIAAPAAGAQDRTDVDLAKASQRYRALCDLGDAFGVVPQVEVWGFSKTLTTLSQATYVAMESGHPRACVLADVYHLHKGGSDPNGLRLLSADAMHVMHVNDYPGEPPREKITDAMRVYPGDGVAPLKQIFTTLRDIGYRGYLSLELFNEKYWKESDALTVAETGLRKTREAVRKAFA